MTHFSKLTVFGPVPETMRKNAVKINSLPNIPISNSSG